VFSNVGFSELFGDCVDLLELVAQCRLPSPGQNARLDWSNGAGDRQRAFLSSGLSTGSASDTAVELRSVEQCASDEAMVKSHM